ncbi:hypothetical protein LCGC14_0538340 [marine sediment metagenome]|uniref:Uncharacterized protein n=1 Tax=marine sediment metagenome TaxID=412755 RepID=A0A0F9UF38_9ZZZZ|nr:hypothetical protein [bacterium]
MIGKKGRGGAIGFALLTVLFVIILTLTATIEPFKEVFDEARGNAFLNCPGTPDFNQTDFDDDDKFDKLNKRPVCFVTGIGMVWFIGAVLISSIMWLVSNWTRSKPR